MKENKSECCLLLVGNDPTVIENDINCYLKDGYKLHTFLCPAHGYTFLALLIKIKESVTMENFLKIRNKNIKLIQRISKADDLIVSLTPFKWDFEKNDYVDKQTNIIVE